MSDRIGVIKTFKLYVDGQFPRSESGRSLPVHAADGSVLAHVAHASRKDLRDAVEAARKGLAKWSGSTAYLRGQILYRMAEMLEGKRAEFAECIDAAHQATKPAAKQAKKGPRRAGGASEVELAIDRLVHYAGWADKYAQVLGCNNPVAGPHYNFTVPEPTGVVACIAPDESPLLALVSLVAPVVCSGNCVVAVASDANPLPGALLGEVCATGDVPPGVINLLTGTRAELLPHIAQHRDIDGVHAADLPAKDAATLRAGIAENIKRVVIHGAAGATAWEDAAACEHPWWIEPFVEMKTIWHPASV